MCASHGWRHPGRDARPSARRGPTEGEPTLKHCRFCCCGCSLLLMPGLVTLLLPLSRLLPLRKPECTKRPGLCGKMMRYGVRGGREIHCKARAVKGIRDIVE